MEVIHKYGLLIVRNNKFLIVREKDTKYFLMPGGRAEKGESRDECFSREIMEELECEVDLDSLDFIGIFEDVAINDPGKKVRLELYKGEVIGKLSPNSEIEELRWFGKRDDKEILSPLIKNRIFPLLVEKEII